MHIGYILAIIFLVVWLGIKVAEKIIKERQKKELEEQAAINAVSERSNINDLIL